MNIDDLSKRIVGLINLGNLALQTKGATDEVVNSLKYHEFRAASLSFLESTFGKTHAFVSLFIDTVSGFGSKYDIDRGLGILQAAKSEIDGGWIFTTKGLVSAEIFSDFAEMSSHLLEEGYKDAAAVVIGSVLEGHIKQLCLKNNLELKNTKGENIKATVLNDNLYKAHIYNKITHKSISAWQGLRNSAAHGQFDDYTSDEVKLMMRGILLFLEKYPL